MKKTILILLTAFCSYVSFSQIPAYTWSPAHTKPAKNIEVQIFGKNADGYFVVSKKPASGMEFSPTITVEYFNEKQDRMFVKNVTPSRQEDYVNVLFFNQSLYLINALFSKDAGKNVLSATPVASDGSLGKPVELASIAAGKLSERGLFKVAVSPSGNHLFVITEPDYRKGENEEITATLYSEQFTKKWQSTKTFPYPWTKAVENTPYVNNDGTTFIVKKTDMKGSDNTYSIFGFDGKQLSEFKIELDGKKKVATWASAIAPNGDLAVGGYYSEESKVRAGIGNALQGMFLHRISKEGNKAVFGVVVPFEKRKDIIAKDIIFSGNRTILLGERYYISSQAPKRDPSKPMTNDNMFERDLTYYGEDIIIDGFDEKGSTTYFTSIKKSNRSNNDNGTWVSYFAAIVKEKIVFVFIDDKSNYDEKKRKIIFGGSPKIIVTATVDPNTGIATEPDPVDNTGPVGGKEGDMLLRPDVFLKIDETHYLIRAENTSIYRMGKLSF